MCSTFFPLTLRTLFSHQLPFLSHDARSAIPRKHTLRQSYKVSVLYIPHHAGSKNIPVPRTTTSYSGAISSILYVFVFVKFLCKMQRCYFASVGQESVKHKLGKLCCYKMELHEANRGPVSLRLGGDGFTLSRAIDR